MNQRGTVTTKVFTEDVELVLESAIGQHGMAKVGDAFSRTRVGLNGQAQ